MKVINNIVYVLLNAIEDSGEIIDRQCGLCMTGECVCVCVEEVDICTNVVSVSISVINKCTATYTMYITAGMNLLCNVHLTTYPVAARIMVPYGKRSSI